MIDERTRTATLAGDPLELARKEFDLLLALAQRAGQVVTKQRAARRGLAAGRTAAPTAPSTCTCRGCVASSARPRPSRATCISVRGVGVRLVDPPSD